MVQITEITKRTFNRTGKRNSSGREQIADPPVDADQHLGCLPFEEGDLPVTVQVKGARVRAWQGIPDITVDNADQLTVLETRLGMPGWI